MAISKNFPVEVRFGVSEEMHTWVKSAATERGQSIGAFFRGLAVDAKNNLDCEKKEEEIGELFEEKVVEVLKKQSVCFGKK
jgi:hypothetical protein